MTGDEGDDVPVQQTLSGGTTTADREYPETFVVCTETGERVLRNRRDEWPHDTVELDEASGEAEAKTPPDPPDIIGVWFDVTLSYSVDYRFRVPAYSQHSAEERAKDLVKFGNCADAHHVHSDIREIDEVTKADVDEDWSYGDPLDDHIGDDE